MTSTYPSSALRSRTAWGIGLSGCGATTSTTPLLSSEGEVAGIDHYCFEVRDWNELKVWCDTLAADDVRVSWGPGRHGPGNNLFIMFDDPDDIHIELSCEMERFWDDNATYGEPRNWASELRTVNLWGPAPEWRTPLERVE